MLSIKAQIFERPEMEYPVYVIKINNTPKYLQRMENGISSGYAWYEVRKDGNFWCLNEQSAHFEPSILGFTKHEAIECLLNKYTH